MCGSLRNSWMSQTAPIKVGAAFPLGVKLTINGKESTKQVVFNGNSRSEALSNWTKNGWAPGILHVDRFTEGGKEFKVPSGYALKVVVLQKDKNHASVVTREAKDDGTGFTAKESSVHPRWPVLEKV